MLANQWIRTAFCFHFACSRKDAKGSCGHFGQLPSHDRPGPAGFPPATEKHRIQQLEDVVSEVNNIMLPERIRPVNQEGCPWAIGPQQKRVPISDLAEHPRKVGPLVLTQAVDLRCTPNEPVDSSVHVAG